MKMFKYIWIILLLLSAHINTSTLYAQPIKLAYSNFFPPTHVQSKLAQQWCDEIKKRTNGKVFVEYYPGQTLLSQTPIKENRNESSRILEPGAGNPSPGKIKAAAV